MHVVSCFADIQPPGVVICQGVCAFDPLTPSSTTAVDLTTSCRTRPTIDTPYDRSCPGCRCQGPMLFRCLLLVFFLSAEFL